MFSSAPHCVMVSFYLLVVLLLFFFFFFNDTATTEIYTLSLHDALPISAMAFPRATYTPSSLRTPTRNPTDNRNSRCITTISRPTAPASATLRRSPRSQGGKCAGTVIPRRPTSLPCCTCWTSG